MLLDVREPHEWDIVHIDGSKLIPLRDFPERVNELRFVRRDRCVLSRGRKKRESDRLS